MTTAVLRVTDLVGSIGTVTETGGVAEDTLKDASDATYVSLLTSSSADAAVGFSLGTFTLGTGRLKSWSVQLRMLRSTASQPVTVGLGLSGDQPISQGTVTPPTTAFANLVTAAQVPPSYTQAQIDDLTLVLAVTQGDSYILLVSEALVAVTYATIPVANLTYPTGNPTIGLSTPVAIWTHTPGSDGGPQAQSHRKVFTNAVKIGGTFDPDTSATVYDSGVVTSGANSAAIGPLPNSSNLWVYVRTAQMINGVPHWSAWDGEQFQTNYTPSSVSTVVATVDTGAPASNLIVVTRNTGTSAWASIEVEASHDAGATWRSVRGATGVKAVNAHVWVWGANSIEVHDWEAPNGQAVLYRARATTTAGITGAWVTSSSVTWTSTFTYLIDPLDPTKGVPIRFRQMPQFTYPRTAGMAPVVGRTDMFVTVDVIRLAEGTMVFHTQSLAGRGLFRNLLASTTWMVKAPASHMVGEPEPTGAGGTTFYCVPVRAEEIRAVRNAQVAHRYWQVDFVQVARPADDTDYS